ncbi:MAG: alanine racemase [Candidatus Coatesbacteria bacterium]|nr:alanine racemase [Candidatus Coatesbacteria bacterium]
MNSWIEIDKASLLQNLDYFRQSIKKDVKIASVIKANAYGHGIEEVASIIADRTDFFAVHSIEEARIIRRFKKPILIMGYVQLKDIEEAIESDYHFAVYNIETIMKISEFSIKLNKDVLVHLKIETGTNRLGFTETELRNAIGIISRNEKIKVCGAYTHFANIEDTTNHYYAELQLSRFNERLNTIETTMNRKVDYPHTACSAASLLFEEAQFKMIRLGIALYGLWPSKETLLSFMLKKHDDSPAVLKPVLSWKTRVAQLKWVEEGDYIGYGCSYRTTSKTRLAILPIGYSDGLDRSLSNNGYVLINGKRAHIRGRICMNLTIVDVTHIEEVKLENEVVIIGKSGYEQITAEYHASWANTINYEIIARLGGHIKRIII